MTDRIPELIRVADRPRQATALERERIRAKAFGADAAEDLVLFDSRRIGERQRGRRARRLSWTVLGGVAASVVMLAIVIGIRDADEPPPPAATVPSPTTPDLLVQACTTSLPGLGEVLAEWGSLSDWAFSQNGDPDVGAPLVAFLRELEAIEPDLSGRAGEVEGAIAALPENRSTPSQAENAELDRVATAALTEAVSTLRLLDPQRRCDVAALVDALN